MRTIYALGILGGLTGGIAQAGEPTEKTVAKPTEGKIPVQSEQTQYLQRLAICTKLRVIAAGSNDAELMAQAVKLETMATEIYERKLQISVATATATDTKAKETALDAKKKAPKTPDEVVEFARNGRPIRSKEANQ